MYNNKIKVYSAEKIAKIDDIELPEGYRLINLVLEKYEREGYNDYYIHGYLETPNGYPARYEGKPLALFYDIHSNYNSHYYCLNYIDFHWELPKHIWETVESKLTEIALIFSDFI